MSNDFKSTHLLRRYRPFSFFFFSSFGGLLVYDHYTDVSLLLILLFAIRGSVAGPHHILLNIFVYAFVAAFLSGLTSLSTSKKPAARSHCQDFPLTSIPKLISLHPFSGRGCLLPLRVHYFIAWYVLHQVSDSPSHLIPKLV